jgi:hypothetical protein
MILSLIFYALPSWPSTLVTSPPLPSSHTIFYKDITTLDTHVSKIWARGTCTARICDHRQAISPADVKEEPTRVDAIDQRGDQGKLRQTYLDDC